ncbi:MAG: Holliday junction resolvase RuvX [Candidatus Sumerlaeia bacterium]|nr:Holliday junction resolvase RuvX [Candidatus Sumerlaeia bacterium]
MEMRATRPAVYLGLDVGDARIGVAISRSGVISDTRETIHRVGRKQTLNAIEKVVVEEGVTVAVLGLPLLEGGTEGEQAEKTRAFARSLQRRLPHLKICFQDERHSSNHAREIIGGRVGGKGRVDQVAAAVILQEWLDSPAREQLTEKINGDQSPSGNQGASEQL